MLFLQLPLTLLTVLQWRDAELLMESLDEIRAIRETAPQTGILYTVTDPQKLLGFGKTAGLNVLRRRGLEIGGEMPVQGAVGDEEPLAQGCYVEGRFMEMPGNV